MRQNGLYMLKIRTCWSRTESTASWPSQSFARQALRGRPRAAAPAARNPPATI